MARLRARPRFALGLALAAAVAHDDPSRPASIARDAARTALRAAVAVDPALARPWNDLAALALEDERPRDAIEAGRAAARAAPGWFAPQLLLARAFTARGLEFDANRAVEAAAGAGLAAIDQSRLADAPCPVIEALRRRAQDRRALEQEARLEAALKSCGGNVEARVERMRARGDFAGAIAALREALRLDPERDDLVGDLATLLSASGRHDAALAEMSRLVARDPNDPQRRLRLADAQAAAGQSTAARETIAALLAGRPDVPEVQRAARALGVPLPLDDFRVDGRAIIRAFQEAAVRYTAPAVMVLDRAVMRIFPGGTVTTLTHQIVRVDSKDAVDKWAEIAIPAGAEILSVRTHKRDGSTREPEEIAGKETISAADVAIGDFIEWEYLETRAPSAAFAPGFLVDRFFFQSFDAPMARSELLLVSPVGEDIELDTRAGAPRPQTRVAVDGTRITSFQATNVPQLFAERAAVPAIEYVPSVRASAGVDWPRWARYLGEELHDALRSSPELREQARHIAGRGAGRPARARRGAGRLGDREHRGDRRARRSRQLRAGPRPRQPHRADAGAGARARHPRASRAGALAPGRRRRRRRCRRRSWTTSPTRSSSWMSARRARRARRPSSTPTCACGTRRSATCRPGWTGRGCCASPTEASVSRARPRRRIAGRST